MTEISRRREYKWDNAYQNVCHSSVVNMTPAWYLSKSRYQVRDGNSFQVYCSGEDVFGAIADSILNAKKSVDIVCTFFDPAMLLTRKHADYSTRGEDNKGNPLPSAWHEDDSFGGIIINALKEHTELNIRLVIWLHEGVQIFTDSNIIGINSRRQEASITRNERATGFDIRDISDPGPRNTYINTQAQINVRKYGSLKLRSRTQEAAEYSRKWFQRATWEVDGPDSERHPLFDRLCIVRRAITTPWTLDQEDDVYGAEGTTRQFGCDHQKTVLIDIDDAASPDSDPHGYVLGHNYFTDYWSAFPFVHRDTRSEMDYAPYHDFSMQIRGPLLIDLNANFCEAYGANVLQGAPQQRLGSLTQGRVQHPRESGTRIETGVYYSTKQRQAGRNRTVYVRPERKLETENAHALYVGRALMENLFWVEKGKASGQVVRTRPDQMLEGAQEKEIKDAYLQIVRHATNFILIVNQYFQYNKLARQIKHWKIRSNESFAKACNGQEPRTLYLFLGTCKAEQHGMVFRTQQMANEFGVGDQLETAFNEMYDKETVNENDGGRREMRYQEDEEPAWKSDEDNDSVKSPYITNVFPMEHIVSKDMESMHIKPLMFMFYALPKPEESRSNNPADGLAQQVYVHAKLMIEDDAWFTLGSANTNIRSFAVDSELNIISDDKETTRSVRHELLREYVGTIDDDVGEVFPNAEGRELSQANLENIYLVIKKRMEQNYAIVMKPQKGVLPGSDPNKKFNGLIAKYHDDRTVNVTRVL